MPAAFPSGASATCFETMGCRRPSAMIMLLLFVVYVLRPLQS